MHVHILQQLTTIRGAASTNVTQAEDDWLDLANYADVILLLHVTEVFGSTPQIAFETSPAKDSVLFQSMVVAANMAAGLTQSKVILATNPSVPLARWLRWTITGPAATWDATFRCYAYTNPAP